MKPIADQTQADRSWVALFSDSKTFCRFALFCVVMVAVCLLAVRAFFAFTKPDTITLDKGTLTISGIGQPKRWIVLLPASQLWFNTHIEMKQGQRAHIVSTGRISLSVFRLVEAADKGEPGPDPLWNDPSGIAVGKQTDPLDRFRRPLWLDPDAPLGSVLAYVSSINSAPTSVAHAKGIVSVKDDGRIESEIKGELWLTVNDWIFEPTAENHDIYVASPTTVGASQFPRLDSTFNMTRLLESRWQKYKNEGRREAFFDDNIGDFLVQITLDD